MATSRLSGPGSRQRTALTCSEGGPDACVTGDGDGLEAEEEAEEDASWWPGGGALVAEQADSDTAATASTAARAAPMP